MSLKFKMVKSMSCVSQNEIISSFPIGGITLVTLTNWGTFYTSHNIQTMQVKLSESPRCNNMVADSHFLRFFGTTIQREILMAFSEKRSERRQGRTGFSNRPWQKYSSGPFDHGSVASGVCNGCRGRSPRENLAFYAIFGVGERGFSDDFLKQNS